MPTDMAQVLIIYNGSSLIVDLQEAFDIPARAGEFPGAPSLSSQHLRYHPCRGEVT